MSQVAVILYTLRDFCKTPADLAATLHRVREIGYTAVQVSGIGDIAPQEVRQMLDAEGLTCCATHESPDLILDEPKRVADKLVALNCRHVAFPSPGNAPIGTEDEVKALAARLNTAGKYLDSVGMHLSYHNHHLEFRRVGGRTVLEILYAETGPRYLQSELDTYWVQHGGGDPVAWCRRLKDRLPLLHMKDYVVSRENKATFAEIGQGNLDWPAIVAAADEAGCQWYIVEQDTCERDPFESIRMSYEYIRLHLATS